MSELLDSVFAVPGEHGQCYPLGPSGFSYNPEDFMAKGIFFYNYAWPDFGIPNINELIDVVQVSRCSIVNLSLLFKKMLIL